MFIPLGSFSSFSLARKKQITITSFMASVSIVNLFFNILISVHLVSFTLSCSNNNTLSSDKVYNSCIELPYLEAHLHWNYNSSLKKVSIAYSATQVPEGWVAWGINPSGEGMLGTQALVAFHHANGTMAAYQTSLTSYNPSMLPEQLSFQASNISAEYKNNEMIIYAEIGPLESGTIVNHVWQSGSSVWNGIPQIHSFTYQHLQSMGEIDFQSA